MSTFYPIVLWWIAWQRSFPWSFPHRTVNMCVSSILSTWSVSSFPVAQRLSCYRVTWRRSNTTHRRRQSVSQRHVITWSYSVPLHTRWMNLSIWKSQSEVRGEYPEPNRLISISHSMSFSLDCKCLFSVPLPDWLQGLTPSPLLKLYFTCLGAVMVCLHLASKLKAYNWTCIELVFHQQTPSHVHL